MKFTINIEKRFAYVVIGVLIVVLGALIVYSYNTGPASFVGHTWDEVICDNNLCVDTNSNNVGIGTANPQEKLDINGNVKANDYYVAKTGKWVSDLGGSTSVQYGLYGECMRRTASRPQCRWAIPPASCSGNSCVCPAGYSVVETGHSFPSDFEIIHYSCYKN